MTAWACRSCGKLTQNWRICQVCKQPAEFTRFIPVEKVEALCPKCVKQMERYNNMLDGNYRKCVDIFLCTDEGCRTQLAISYNEERGTMRDKVENNGNEMYAIVELMGHGQTAGRISKPADWGGLLRVDVPEGDGYRTEYYGISAIYSVKMVSEEIARAYSTKRSHAIVSYDTPIVTREQHLDTVDKLEQQNRLWRDKVMELERRLTAVRALPEPETEDDPQF